MDRPPPLGRRGATLLSILSAALVAWFVLGLGPQDLVPRRGGAAIAGEFFGAALSPALDYEAEYVPAGAPAFLARVLEAIARTVAYAAGAISLALVGGIVLGFAASSSWWTADPLAPPGLRRLVGPSVQGATRLLIALLRSVHELLWAVVFLAAFGMSSATAVLALALPYAGTLAKVFSEMLDEAPAGSANALRAAGAAPGQVFVFGQLPRALPDMGAYGFYRFECAIRSSAVLGFFGYETLGYYLSASFENLHYREVWTFLYALIALVLLFEAWSAVLRRRFVA